MSRMRHVESALSYAAKEGLAGIAQLLIKKGADMSVSDSNGMTALHWAAYNGHNETLKWMAEENPQLLKMKNYTGITARKVAEERGLGRGYRLVINEGEYGGKLVPHFHLHLLSGRRLGAKLVSE